MLSVKKRCIHNYFSHKECLKQLFLLFLFAFYSSSALGQFTFNGVVTDTEENEPVPGVMLEIHELHRQAVTNNEGEFFFHGLNKGHYHVHLTAVGFKTLTFDLHIDSDTSMNLQIDLTTEELDEVVIEVKHTKTTEKKSSVSIKHYDNKYLRKHEGPTLMESLESEPGISSISIGSGMSKPMIRGLSKNRVTVVDQGIKQQGQQWGTDHGLEIDQYSINGLDIVKGPSALIYGTDAIGGVLITQPYEPPHDTLFNVDARTVYKSNNDKVGGSANIGGQKSSFVYNVRGTYLRYGDYRLPADSFRYANFILPIYNNRLKNTAGRELHFNASAGIHKSWGYSHFTVTSYNQRMGLFSGAMGIPTAYGLQHDGDYRNIDLPYQQVNHTKVTNNTNVQIGNNWLEADVGYQFNDRQEIALPHAHGSGQTSTEALLLKLHSLSANVRFHHHVSEETEVIYGIHTVFQDQSIGGFEFLLPAYQSADMGTYSLVRHDISDKLFLSGGFRINTIHYNMEESNFPFYRNNQLLDTVQRNPDLERNLINYAWTTGFSWVPTDVFNLKFNVGRTFRFPNVPEFASNGVHHGAFRYERGDPNLEAERGYQFDLSLHYRKNRLKVELSPFFNLFNNYIYLAPTGRFATITIGEAVYPFPEPGQVYEYRQAPVLHTGGEMNITYKLHRHISIGCAPSIVWLQNTDTNAFLPFTPPYNTYFNLEASTGRRREKTFTELYAQLQWGLYAEQERTARNEDDTPGYNILNFTAGATIGKAPNAIDINFRVQNIFNTYYFNHLAIYRQINLPEPGRNISISVGYNL